MEILDPDLWNEDGTPKRPSQQYMDGLAMIQASYEGMAKLAENTPEVHASDKPMVQAGESYLNYARIKRESKAQRPPEVGDIVHFWNDGEPCRAAMVMETESFGHGAWLRVHIPNKPFEDWQCDHDETKQGESWHWPCGEGQ